MYYIAPENRQQLSLMNSLEDMVAQDHYVRLIDDLIDRIVKENENRFINKGLAKTGRKPYHPATLLKLYLYGYLNGVNSSRKLETECKRNIEMMWLLGNLIPDHKTISDFRKNNSEQIQLAVEQFNLFLKQGGYLKAEVLSVDGSKIRANAGKVLSDDIEKRLNHLQQQIGGYLAELDGNDRAEQTKENVTELEKQQTNLEENIKHLQQEIEKLKEQKKNFKEEGLDKYSPTDPDARLMKGREGKHFAYNVQAAIDSTHKLIAALEVSTQQNDRALITPMIATIRKKFSITPKEIIADAGYSNIADIQKAEQEERVNCYVALNDNQHQVKDQMQGFVFTYSAQTDRYTCIKGQPLVLTAKNKIDKKRGTSASVYRGINCRPCEIKNDCTKSSARTIMRYTDRQWRDDYRQKMKSALGKTKLRLRKSLSEHPFGILKQWMGKIPIKLRGKKKVQTEMNIYHLAYNLKRMTSIESFFNFNNLIEQHDWKIARQTTGFLFFTPQ